MNRRLRSTVLRTLLATLTSAVPAAAQCAGWDQRYDFHPGLNNRVYATAVYDDGTGPALYAGGDFSQAAGMPASHIAKWNGAMWSGVGASFFDQVFCLTVFDDGSGAALYAGVTVANGGGIRDTQVAKWNGTSWSTLGSGFMNSDPYSPEIWSLAAYDDGSGPALFASGVFNTAGGVAANGIAKWNGTSWSPLGSGLSPIEPVPSTMAVFDDGTGSALYVGGLIHSAGGVPANYIARWNGSSWSSVGGGMDNSILAFAVFDDGTGPALYAAGAFLQAGGHGVGRIAKWNGMSWSDVGGGLGFTVIDSLGLYDDGSGAALFAGGLLNQAGSVTVLNIAKWSGSSWSALANGLNAEVRSLSVFDDGHGAKLIAAGDFIAAGSLATDYIASWNGSSWSELGTHGGLGTSGAVQAFAAFDDGSGLALYAGGNFADAGDVNCRSIAKWDGSHWSPLAGGLDVSPYFPATVFALAAYDDGQGSALYAAGSFNSSGPFLLNGIAKWSGGHWSSLGNGVGPIDALTVLDDGSGSALYAGGGFIQANGVAASRVARWNGSSWSAVGGGVNAGYPWGIVSAMAAFDSGSGPELYVGGDFVVAGGGLAHDIARWNGSTWSAVGNGVSDRIFAFVVFDNGTGPSLYAGGAFTHTNGIPANHVARWDGRDWSALGSGLDDTVNALCVFDDGSGPALVATGLFTHAGSVAVNRVAKWNGTSWSALGTGVGSTPSEEGNALAAFDDGSGGHADLFVGGLFDTAGGGPSKNIAQWHDCFPGAPFCFGDGSLAVACPCANFGAIGHGCQNSAATGGAVLRTTGTTHPDTLVLTTSGELPSVLSIFLQGDAKLVNGTSFGDGVRCAAGHLKRLFVKSANSGSATVPGAGDPSVSARSAALGDPIPMGALRYYQTYYRDPHLGYCPSPQGDSWNVTNGVQVAW